MNGNGKIALITGISGFTGYYMAAELSAAGYRVYGIGSIESERKDYFSVDLMDYQHLQKVIELIQPDVVVHLAAIAFVGHGDPAAFYNVNVVGTRNLLQALASIDKKPQSVLLASSANVYGNSREGQLDELTPANPANDYAVSKLAMEYMAMLWKDKLPIVITRPFNYTGIGQPEGFLLPKIVKHFREKAVVIELGNLDVWRDFSDVRVLANTYLRLLHSDDAIGQIVNVCSGTTYSLRDIISYCEEITQHHLTIKVNPAFVRANEVKILSGSAEKLQALIGDWQPIPIVDTLHWMLES
jgi:nucleoside-diphosphate-sugar epimerase